MDHFSAS
nr:ORF2 protein [Vibrio cholerae]